MISRVAFILYFSNLCTSLNFLSKNISKIRLLNNRQLLWFWNCPLISFQFKVRIRKLSVATCFVDYSLYLKISTEFRLRGIECFYSVLVCASIRPLRSRILALLDQRKYSKHSLPFRLFAAQLPKFTENTFNKTYIHQKIYSIFII